MACEKLTISDQKITYRPPEEILTLEHMGHSFPSRISFMRNLIRKMHHQKWIIEISRFALDENGYGHAVYHVKTGKNIYSLVVFTNELDPAKRTDRVIAEAWDATFNLFDGIPTDLDIKRLAANTYLQEAGRFSACELVLGRANKSLRLFSYIVAQLKKGQQPDIDRVAEVGYLMRTTAVYGSGKFGCADRGLLEKRPEMRASFHVELLTVYLFRAFTIDLVDHIARAQAPDKAVTLDRRIKRYLGVGNSTGLGMAPFLLRHSKLMHRWVSLREEALYRVRCSACETAGGLDRLKKLMPQIRQYLEEWNVKDSQQMAKIRQLRASMIKFESRVKRIKDAPEKFWEHIYQYARHNLNPEARSFIDSLLIECNGPLVDDLGDQMYADEGSNYDPGMSLDSLCKIIKSHYHWIDQTDFTQDDSVSMFWYYSEEKLEPRFGDSRQIKGSERAMPLAIGRDIWRLQKSIRKWPPETRTGDFIRARPEYRHLVKRIQTRPDFPYGEITDNLISAKTRPVDLLRFKLAFFGASKFDPKSSLWMRITLYQGAPLADEIQQIDPDAWAYPVKPGVIKADVH